MISVCIPTYEQYGYGAGYLRELLDSLARQLGVTFEVVISDNSRDDAIEKLCRSYKNKNLQAGLCGNLNYIRNNITYGVANNTNNAIAHAAFDFIKIMYQDDVLSQKYSLQLFEEALKRKPWVISSWLEIDEQGRFHGKHDPFWNQFMLKGRNTFGMPSAVAIQRNGVAFDPKLRTLLDCEYYWLLHEKYGEPEYIERSLVSCRYWHQSASMMQRDFGVEEYEYLAAKHGLKDRPAPTFPHLE
jgi:glycosyltransferase involved in cell wall biosynthesis